MKHVFSVILVFCIIGVTACVGINPFTKKAEPVKTIEHIENCKGLPWLVNPTTGVVLARRVIAISYYDDTKTIVVDSVTPDADSCAMPAPEDILHTTWNFIEVKLIGPEGEYTKTDSRFIEPHPVK